MSAIGRRAFGSTEVKYAVAAVFLVGAVSVAAWRLVGNRRPSTATSRAPMVGEAVNDTGEAVETNYTKVKSDSDIREVMTEFADDVTRSAGSLDLSGGGDAERVASAARDAIEPLLLNDYDEFLAAIERLGGTIDPDAEERSRLYEMLSGWFAMGDPDLDRIKVAPYTGMNPGARGGAQPRRVSRTVDENEEGPGGPGGETGVAERRMAMRAQSLFPDADAEDQSGVQPIEVSVPIRPTGGPHKGGEVTLGVVLAWNAETETWQPGMYSMTTYSVVEGEDGP